MAFAESYDLESMKALLTQEGIEAGAVLHHVATAEEEFKKH